jgi:hypothetical protein
MMVNQEKRDALKIERLRELLEYEESTGLWSWRVAVSPIICARDYAGYVRSDGRRVIVIDGNLYLAANLAWFYMTGEWPSEDVDHKNRIKSDDKWTNLRLSTKSQSVANRNMMKNNTSGFPGVTKKKNRWVARVQQHGIMYQIGSFLTPETAFEAYKKEHVKRFGEFSPFYVKAA